MSSSGTSSPPAHPEGWQRQPCLPRILVLPQKLSTTHMVRTRLSQQEAVSGEAAFRPSQLLEEDVIQQAEELLNDLGATPLLAPPSCAVSLLRHNTRGYRGLGYQTASFRRSSLPFTSCLCSRPACTSATVRKQPLSLDSLELYFGGGAGGWNLSLEQCLWR